MGCFWGALTDLRNMVAKRLHSKAAYRLRHPQVVHLPRIILAFEMQLKFFVN